MPEVPEVDNNPEVIEQFRQNTGKVPGYESRNLLLLTTTGRKSGEPRTTPLSFVRFTDCYVVAASHGGSDRNPAWLLNLRANHDATVEVVVGGEVRALRVVAREPSSNLLRDLLFENHIGRYPDFAEYAKRTRRVIPMVMLVVAG